MYKTGDLVRYMEDGSILYIGRGDMQLKLHRQRLESEDVQQRIQEVLFDAQLQVIVDIARFEGQHSDVLVACLTQKVEYRGGEMDIDHVLQQHLADMKEHIVRQISTPLPKYMIPSVSGSDEYPCHIEWQGGPPRTQSLRCATAPWPHLLLSRENKI